jgi:hypothetical protein
LIFSQLTTRLIAKKDCIAAYRPVALAGMADDRAWSEEWRTDPLCADDRNFYKVEL